ncbi:hypothetical protein [Entomomonas asaccharolytica]|uniref:N-acetyltransferase domain-containing protein n=1 Tax=Entomomonas asaccharolytica TaxID=2785331 RepID=A0A974NHX2_9GAMM|nr:hypothetical protein [Entomomonas asaccharolytica]QQP86784.1 hypothetical protein JHT90_05970 [Entomomonas asaccharolytica]
MINFHAVSATNQQYFLKLLEENAMQGWVDMLMTRQPNYLNKQHYFGQEYPILAEQEGSFLGCCQLTRQQGFVNGQLVELGYLNSLRVSKNYRNKIRVLKEGFNYLKHFFSPPDYCYTSIASDNKTARRILEKGVAGLPKYQLLGELCTFVIAKQRAKDLGLWQKVEQPQAIVDFYNKQAIQYQLAPYLTEDWLIKASLPVLGYYQNNQLQGCTVLWNQQQFKQIVAAHYHPMISLLRPVYNGYAKLTKRPTLPRLKQVLDQTFLSFFQVQDQRMIIPLIKDALHHCQTSLLTFSLAANHPQASAIINIFKPLLYKTRIYGVELVANPRWEKQMLNPEAAIL